MSLVHIGSTHWVRPQASREHVLVPASFLQSASTSQSWSAAPPHPTGTLPPMQTRRCPPALPTQFVAFRHAEPAPPLLVLLVLLAVLVLVLLSPLVPLAPLAPLAPLVPLAPLAPLVEVEVALVPLLLTPELDEVESGPPTQLTRTPTATNSSAAPTTLVGFMGEV